MSFFSSTHANTHTTTPPRKHTHTHTHPHPHNMKKHARTNTHMLTIYPVIPVYFVYIVSAKLYVSLVVVVCCGVLVLLSYMICVIMVKITNIYKYTIYTDNLTKQSVFTVSDFGKCLEK